MTTGFFVICFKFLIALPKILQESVSHLFGLAWHTIWLFVFGILLLHLFRRNRHRRDLMNWSNLQRRDWNRWRNFFNERFSTLLHQYIIYVFLEQPDCYSEITVKENLGLSCIRQYLRPGILPSLIIIEIIK